MSIHTTIHADICKMSKIHYRTFEIPFGNDGWKRLKPKNDMIDCIIGDMIIAVERAGYSHKKAMRIARYNLFEYEAAVQAKIISGYLKNKTVPKKLVFDAKIEELED